MMGRFSRGLGKGLTALAGMGVVFGLMIGSANAHPRLFSHSHQVVVKKEVVVNPAPVRNLVAYTIGATFDTLPRNHVRVAHLGQNYYVHDGVYFQRKGARYVVVKPVTGIRVTTLPRGYTTVRIGGRTHYKFNNVTYRRVNNYYVVV
jgi:hypothetical protein